MNLAGILTASAGRTPDRSALRFDDSVVTYADLDRGSAQVAGMLGGLGVGPGDRVGLMLPNVAQFAACYYGILRAGAVVVPMNVLLKGREAAFYLADSEAKVLLAWHQFAEAAEAGASSAGATCVLVGTPTFDEALADVEPKFDLFERAADDTAVILYTSGTTGTPKGAELTHANLTSNATVTANLFGVDERAVILGALPLFHAFGQTCALNVNVQVGACLTLIPRFDPERALQTIARDKVTVFEGVPTMYTAMLHHPNAADFDVSSLSLCVSGGAALPLEVMRGFEEQFGCVIIEGYGLSETSPVASFNHPDRPRKPGSIGTPVQGAEMKVVDETGADLPAGEVGEIVIRGENVMKGYWRLPDVTAEAIVDGWFHTGDLARVDEDGYFFIVDRKKDMIIRGGYNIYPREVEEVLYEHPAIKEVAVVGIPDDYLGEEVGAAVVLRADANATPDEMREFARAEMAAYKYPRHVWVVDELPKGPTGKILKREIHPPPGVEPAAKAD
ncbi:MAG: long-chain fatty acid--CoA ligase [Actinomycetota bacterium]|nr:long-chain fatty acid--CoA ligase [Actinomycetota bacterium]